MRAPHWYTNVHRSTGFAPYQPKQAPFPDKLRGMLEQCRPLYRRPYDHAIRAG